MSFSKLLLFCSTLVILSSCSGMHLNEEVEGVRIVYSVRAVEQCTLLGDIVGSAGTWYSSITPNPTLTRRAMNDLKNNAHALGANVAYVKVDDVNIAYVDDDIGFATSVTFNGQAFQCP